MEKIVCIFTLLLLVFATAVTKSENSSEENSSSESPKNGLYAKDCLNEIQVPDEDIKKLKAKDIANASDKMQCYINCVMEKDEIIADGIFNDDVIYDRLQNVTSMNEENVTKILNICKGIEGEDKCDLAYRLSKCFIEHKANMIVWRIALVVKE